MANFLKNPNLPSTKVEIVAVGEDYAEEIGKALMPFGIKTLCCHNNAFVDSRLRSHIDLSVFHFGGNRFLLSEAVSESGFASELRQLGAEIIVAAKKQACDYPMDAALCALSTGEKLFHNKRVCNPSIIDYYGNRLLHTNQGYAKCAVCLVNETAAISSDSGLAKVMAQEGLDVLRIPAECISLSGFNHGFIGGASFKIAPDKLAFTGEFRNDEVKNSIEEFLRLHDVEPVYLTNNAIFDIGSIIPIIER